MQSLKNKEPLFFLHSLSLPAALRITSYEEGKCARKVNPLLDQSERFLKKTFPALVPGCVKYVPMGNKKPKRWFWDFQTFE